MIEQTARNTVYVVRANALTQMIGFASHFAYTDTVKRNSNDEGCFGKCQIEM